MILAPLLLPAALAAMDLPPQFPAPLAAGDRPDDGVGLFHFEPEDVLAAIDGPEGRVRVHYSVEGPSVTLLDDVDGNGLPDFAEEVAATSEQVLDRYEELGFRLPVSEAEMELGPLGGSAAFDFYLVEFDGNGDGMFSLDACRVNPNHCSGYMVMENDFYGYGYSNLTSAIQTLTSHEIFHAVQMAYESDSPIWYTEGTAEWAQRQFDKENEDFIWFASAYLDDTGRPLDEPPTGPVPTFAYATCLFWEFLTERLGGSTILAIQESLEWNGEDQDTLTNVIIAIEAAGSDLYTEWKTFATWNLITGVRAGVLESYTFAADLDEALPVESAPTLMVDNRFYPIATSYFALSHPGGPLWFSNTDDATGLYFALYAIQDGETRGPLDEKIAEWEPRLPAWTQVSTDLPEGYYWLVGTYPEDADNSQRVQFCLGDEATAEQCLAKPDSDTGDTGDTSVQDTGGGEEPKNCGCITGDTSNVSWAWLLFGLLAPVTRRRR